MQRLFFIFAKKKMEIKNQEFEIKNGENSIKLFVTSFQFDSNQIKIENPERYYAFSKEIEFFEKKARDKIAGFFRKMKNSYPKQLTNERRQN